MNYVNAYATRVFALITATAALALLVTIQPAFGKVLGESNPPYEIVVSGEGEAPPVLKFTINFENGSSLVHEVQGNGTINYENPGHGKIVSVEFLGKTIREGEEVIVRVGDTEVCYRIFWWWFDSGYYRMTARREIIWT